MKLTELYQEECLRWARETFGEAIATSKLERVQRFVEEALELGQSLDLTQEQASTLVAYVYARKGGDPRQEVGGVMVTLGTLCEVTTIDLQTCAEAELQRCWDSVSKIRAKHKCKPDAIKTIPEEK